MQAVIVYESVYGNTRTIAEAIAEGVRESRPDATVSCLPVAEAGPDVTRTADLLVIGGPTHVYGMTTGPSRRMARLAATMAEGDEQAAHASGPEVGPGLRTWFHSLPNTEPGTHAAAFDTRADMLMSGGAAHGIARRLAHHHYDLVADPEGFIVEGTEGPLRTGERERAVAWGAGLTRRPHPPSGTSYGPGPGGS
ncbi:flavodoxin family protein [Kitasatospora sp. NPDC050543]|uniref:flavodoxin family protein n=1 Tax=Kitasatospora sp. NPDC050543 TaxID=3364054 RepID=UPI0037BD3443